MPTSRLQVCTLFQWAPKLPMEVLLAGGRLSNTCICSWCRVQATGNEQYSAVAAPMLDAPDKSCVHQDAGGALQLWDLLETQMSWLAVFGKSFGSPSIGT